MTETVNMTPDELLAAWPILDRKERVEAFQQLEGEDGEEFFTHLDAVDQAELLLDIPQSRRRDLLGLLPPDDLADIFQELDERSQRVVFRTLSEEERAEVEQLASYDFDDAGGLMTPDFAHVLPDMTVDQAIVALRMQLKERPETLRYIYVLERDGRLAGVVSFRSLFGAPPRTVVRELMETDVVTVREDTDQEEVAHLMLQEAITAIPVVDEQGRIKGIITSDDVITVMEEEATEDIHKLAAVAPTETEYLRASVGLLWRRRVGWLMVLLVAGFGTSLVLGTFEETLKKTVLLAFYIPILNGTAGNTGTQSAMLMVRSLATGELQVRNWARVLFKEISVGLLMALLLAATLGLFGYFRGHGGTELAMVLSITMVLVVLWANLLGAVLPVAIKTAGLDPAFVSAPLVTTLTDISSVFIYFTVAGVVLGS